jgi:transposase-like protein
MYRYRYDEELLPHTNLSNLLGSVDEDVNRTRACDKCGSIRTVKYGTSANRQVFKCKDCYHKFKEPTLLKKAKSSPELVTLTLDLYFSGLSLRKVATLRACHYDTSLYNNRN